jgi:hypothetical protein
LVSTTTAVSVMDARSSFRTVFVSVNPDDAHKYAVAAVLSVTVPVVTIFVPLRVCVPAVHPGLKFSQ